MRLWEEEEDTHIPPASPSFSVLEDSFAGATCCQFYSANLTAVARLHHLRSVFLRTSSRVWSVQVHEEAASDEDIFHDRKTFYKLQVVVSQQ